MGRRGYCDSDFGRQTFIIFRVGVSASKGSGSTARGRSMDSTNIGTASQYSDCIAVELAS